MIVINVSGIPSQTGPNFPPANLIIASSSSTWRNLRTPNSLLVLGKLFLQKIKNHKSGGLIFYIGRVREGRAECRFGVVVGTGRRLRQRQRQRQVHQWTVFMRSPLTCGAGGLPVNFNSNIIRSQPSHSLSQSRSVREVITEGVKA